MGWNARSAAPTGRAATTVAAPPPSAIVPPRGQPGYSQTHLRRLVPRSGLHPTGLTNAKNWR